MNNSITSVTQRPIRAGRTGAALLVATLDSTALPDMGDRSLDHETHAYVRPRRRLTPNLAPPVKRRSGLPFPEPRLPDLSIAAARSAVYRERRVEESDLQRLEENAGLRWKESATEGIAAATPLALTAADAQTTQMVCVSSFPILSRLGCSGPTIVVPPRAIESTNVIAPLYSPNSISKTVIRRAEKAIPKPAVTSIAAPAPKAARFVSLEGNLANLSERGAIRVAILAIGVQVDVVGKVNRLAEILRSDYDKRVKVLGAENADGLRMAPTIVGGSPGEICLVACGARTPMEMLPHLASFEGVILMVEIGQTPVDAAASWANSLRQCEIPILGVWAA